MKKTIALLFSIFSFSFYTLYAQDLKVIRATEQNTFGGPVRLADTNSHTRYLIRLSPIKKDIVFDSLYILDKVVLKFDPKHDYPLADNVHNMYTIEAYSHRNTKAAKGTVIPARHFTGAGLLIYTCKGKSYSIPIVNLVKLELR